MLENIDCKQETIKWLLDSPENLIWACNLWEETATSLLNSSGWEPQEGSAWLTELQREDFANLADALTLCGDIAGIAIGSVLPDFVPLASRVIDIHTELQYRAGDPPTELDISMGVEVCDSIPFKQQENALDAAEKALSAARSALRRLILIFKAKPPSGIIPPEDSDGKGKKQRQPNEGTKKVLGLIKEGHSNDVVAERTGKKVSAVRNLKSVYKNWPDEQTKS